MAHSLGAVITYDILTGYLCGSVEDEIALMQQQQLHIPRRVIPHQQGLLFTVSILVYYLQCLFFFCCPRFNVSILLQLDHFFCLGSPLSVFLALRWREPHDPTLRSQILPQHLCRRIYNVFYSSDPVAYRWVFIIFNVCKYILQSFPSICVFIQAGTVIKSTLCNYRPCNYTFL